MIKCETNHCIYNDERECILENISLNVFGCCEECIMPYIDEDLMKQKKVQLLKELHGDELSDKDFLDDK